MTSKNMGGRVRTAKRVPVTYHGVAALLEYGTIQIGSGRVRHYGHQHSDASTGKVLSSPSPHCTTSRWVPCDGGYFKTDVTFSKGTAVTCARCGISAVKYPEAAGWDRCPACGSDDGNSCWDCGLPWEDPKEPEDRDI